MKPGDIQNLRVSFLVTARWNPKVRQPKWKGTTEWRSVRNVFSVFQWQHAYYLKQRVSKRERITCSKLRAEMVAQNVNSNSFVSVALKIARQSVLPQQKNSSCFGMHFLHRSKNPPEQAIRFLSCWLLQAKSFARAEARTAQWIKEKMWVQAFLLPTL
jgi:hypothetical protein